MSTPDMHRALTRLTSAPVLVRLRGIVGVVTAPGWVVGSLALATGVAGVVLGWVEFRFLAMTLAAALLLGLLGLVRRARLRAELELRPSRVVAGERAFGRLLVVNVGSRRSAPTRIGLPIGDAVAEFSIPARPSGGTHEELFAVPTRRRAVIVAGPALWVRGDPLGLVRREVRIGEPVELFVHPRTVRLRPSAAGLAHDLEGETTRALTDNDFAFHALRPYEPGDDRRNVHWRTSARTGRLMVRQFTETRRSNLVVLHDAEASGYAGDGDEFELGVSVVASIGQQMLRDGTRVRVVSSTRELRTSTVTTLLDDSSRLEPLGTGRSLREVAREATRRRPPPSVLIVTVGSAMALEELRAVASLFSTDTRTICLRMQDGAPTRRASVGGLTVATVGALSELPRLLGRLT